MTHTRPLRFAALLALLCAVLLTGMRLLASDTVQQTVVTRTPTAQLTLTPRATQQAGLQATMQADPDSAVVQEFEGVPMVLVPAGCFMMGTEDDTVVSNEGPRHEVCFDEPFWIDQTEVTQAQFASFGGIAMRAPSFSGADRPVENITWFEARDFCLLRGARLPTEAEWEYAARGPESWVYPWGNEWDESKTIWLRDMALGTASVGSIPEGASWVGALDMSGNVWEWTSTASSAYPYDMNDGRESSEGSNAEAWRVLRGGSWFDNSPFVLRTAVRYDFFPTAANWDYGFRCLRSE
ncbi:MAG: formylglycine-generating enzyme family protein [Pleurocapsa minor GSE-CHR-MK-17-07R]|jgi:formylglycine-generating enzyme required for sulfatase activity|nr:formylglycine-generating enzyme family protein [Pleurocapsa minor GSE-CHR-MK 17-07R]